MCCAQTVFLLQSVPKAGRVGPWTRRHYCPRLLHTSGIVILIPSRPIPSHSLPSPYYLHCVRLLHNPSIRPVPSPEMTPRSRRSSPPYSPKPISRTPSVSRGRAGFPTRVGSMYPLLPSRLPAARECRELEAGRERNYAYVRPPPSARASRITHARPSHRTRLSQGGIYLTAKYRYQPLLPSPPQLPSPSCTLSTPGPDISSLVWGPGQRC
ncbi:hypothetical protein GGS23DRAFT_513834 [Durotheca rogersii]|uniref:uncharacterized protein n=1 Tax=Durotheca rogersii TaxID=419775 RepID=UPI00221F92BC|nr:uncharacterized protein GGS23DRAFT_513834 [Durotheca rogersii]KAI5863784.1 hypothetical protein GGS23DRAFT_513834 [Durotheca rogersii]